MLCYLRVCRALIVMSYSPRVCRALSVMCSPRVCKGSLLSVMLCSPRVRRALSVMSCSPRVRRALSVMLCSPRVCRALVCLSVMFFVIIFSFISSIIIYTLEGKHLYHQKETKEKQND